MQRLTRLWESGHTWVMADSACVQAAHMQKRAKGMPPSLPPQAATILQGDTSSWACMCSENASRGAGNRLGRVAGCAKATSPKLLLHKMGDRQTLSRPTGCFVSCTAASCCKQQLEQQNGKVGSKARTAASKNTRARRAARLCSWHGLPTEMLHYLDQCSFSGLKSSQGRCLPCGLLEPIRGVPCAAPGSS